MTIDELKAAAKLRTRKMSTDELDEDVFRYVDFALADLKRIGVAEEYLKAPEDPLIIEAAFPVIAYADAGRFTLMKPLWAATAPPAKMSARYAICPCLNL